VEKQKKLRKMCAVCGDKSQTNVIFKWRRFRNNIIFHVCALCRERGKVNEDTVKNTTNKTYTTVWDGEC
jgi:ssDNA-binding Zn-finger/Zn-ribbon topoisomerase 1